MTELNMAEVSALAADMGTSAARVAAEARPIVTKGAVNVKNQMRADAEASTYFGQIGRAVNFDIRGSGLDLVAEIGYDKGSPGSLANIAIYGTSRGGGTVADPENALADELPRFEQALADLAGRIL